MSLVSVVIPVYNIKPKYLRGCLDSVLQQSYKELEIIVVNDQSTNQDTLDTLSEYETKDQRIKLIHNEQNGGLSFTRNIGVAQATGDYLTFLDSDDQFTPNCIEKMVQAIEQNNTELVICNMQHFVLDEKIYFNYDDLFHNLHPSSYVDMQEFLKQGRLFDIKQSAFAKLMRLDVYRNNNMDFNPKIRIWEDCEWWARVAPKFKSFCFFEFIGVKHLLRSDSLSHESNTKAIYALFAVFKMMYLELKRNNLIALHANPFFNFLAQNTLYRFFSSDDVDQNKTILLLDSFKTFTESCGYIFNKQLSVFQDPQIGVTSLIFQHVSNMDNLIVLNCRPKVSCFIPIWKLVYKVS